MTSTLEHIFNAVSIMYQAEQTFERKHMLKVHRFDSAYFADLLFSF